jgi:hypothetical protein
MLHLPAAVLCNAILHVVFSNFDLYSTPPTFFQFSSCLLVEKKTRGLYFSHMAGHGAVVAILGWENFSL